MSHLEKAAHVTMPVSHSSSSNMILGTYGGAAVGAIGLLAFTWFTGGTGWIVLGLAALGGADKGATIGGKIGEYFDKGKMSAEGELDDGVKDCFIGEERHKAVNNDPAIKSVGKCHDDPVAQGSISVFLGQWNFSRKLDKTKCGGQISDGNQRVFIGGEPTDKGAKIAERLTGAAKGAKLFGLGLSVVAPGGAVGRISSGVEAVGVATEVDAIEKAGKTAGDIDKNVDRAKKGYGLWKDYRSGTGWFKYLK